MEHRAKLSGLLIDRHEVVTVDLTKALQAAKQRALHRGPLPVVPALEDGAAGPVQSAARERNEFTDQAAFGE